MLTPKILGELSPEMLSHLEAFTNYTILHKMDGKKLISSYSLKVFDELFNNEAFIRINRSNLVNKTFVSGISQNKQGTYIHLKNRMKLLIPRRRRDTLLNKYPNLLNLTL